MKLHIKRVYESPSDSDGMRILVDRLWPRGLAKAEARIDFWAREVAPSQELRRWYQHKPEKWPEFQRRYLSELQNNPEAVEELVGKIGKGKATLLFSSKEVSLNNAVVLKEYLGKLL
ncbi:conserved hypothetical protein [Candidatus Methylobacter favarea]|uniref:DUF488 domain-containing protein n=1 Tax=Candidatus Methylobacter favarea TaxID=2707345 RepID=A0A8S0WB82_9GAMM|nr:DUF488 family protein [Candidatus Methylobacter favarea]CAA9891503.1 conserved hypothetical protein [Candidatus Methylobacter favarea]